MLEVIEGDRPIIVGDTPVRTAAPLKDGDTIRIDIGQFLRCNFSERIIEEERNIIRTLEVSEVTHRFNKDEIGLEGNSFSVTRGELVCVMGASGSGKSTLLKVLAGQLQPTSGEVILNGQSLYPNLDVLKRYISYMPQQDAFDEHLTTGENLQFAAATRSPHLSRRDRTRRLDAKLTELGLGERRDAVVGTPPGLLGYLGGAEPQRRCGADLGASPSRGTSRPEFIFGALAAPLGGLSADICCPANSRGDLVGPRRCSPEFWRDTYEAS